MITIFFYQSALFIFIYFLGKKISSKLNSIFKLTTTSIFNNFLLSLFFITLISLFLIFIPIKNEFIYFIFSILLIWSILSIKLSSTDKKNILILIGVSLLLIPFVLNVEIGHDGGLYHVPFQTWIKNHKITIGLSNLHTRYALILAYDYLSSMFINNFFTINAFLQSCFLIIFFSFFYELLRDIKKSIFYYLSNSDHYLISSLAKI